MKTLAMGDAMNTMLTRVDVQSAISRLCWALRQRNSRLSTRTVETGGFGVVPVGFTVQIFDRDRGPVNTGFTDTGQGISRDPDHVLRADAVGWDVLSLGLGGTWGIDADVELPATFITEVIEWRKTP